MKPKDKAKDKAKELVNKFFPDLKSITEMGFSHGRKEYAKQCALICVDEIIKEIKTIEFENEFLSVSDNVRYWNEVKQEINKI